MNELEGDALIPSIGTVRTSTAQPARLKRLSQRIVLREITNAGGAIRAYELAQRLERTARRKISVNSVYRILGALEVRNLVRRVECLKAWVPVPAHGGGASLHLICSACGAIRSVPAPCVAHQLGQLAESRRFAASRLVIETIGLCSRCSS